jgi:two-component system cell cycle response regulator DivK
VTKRILVVEDQEDNLQILRDLLTSAGFEIIEAKDGEEGVRAAVAERPDLILMDIQLPLLDGYEATRRIKAAPALRAIPIIVVTSYALGAVARLVGIEGGVVSGVFNLESPGVEAPDWRPRHGKQYHEV